MTSASGYLARIESNEFPCDDLRVTGFTGREAISEPFSFDIDLVRLGADALPSAAGPGARLTLVLEGPDGEPRRLHGMVERLKDRLSAVPDHRAYRLRLVPRVARLGFVETQEIHLDRSVPEIIEHKLSQVGLTGGDVEMRLSGSYPPREFVVQYRESDLAFVSRLGEHVGLSYFFRHEEDADVVVFTDGRFDRRAGRALPYDQGRDHAAVFELDVESAMAPDLFAVQDYNYRHPLAEMWASHTLDEGTGGGVVEYGTHHKSKAEGDTLARVRAEERRAAARVFEGKSRIPALAAGVVTSLDGHPLLDTIHLLPTEVRHVFRQNDAESAPAGYSNAFRAVPADVPYRTPRRTPKPRIAGVVTAVVQPPPGGKLGGRAWIDDHGRYTVAFHFDASPAKPRPSRPIRMAQPYVGPDQGMHFPLRAGAEVVVAFLDGDPDRPVILGAVPNTIMPSPVTAATSDKHRITTGNGAIIFEMGHGK